VSLDTCQAKVLLVLDSRTREILAYTDNAICALFFLDFLISVYQAPNKGQYLLRWGWLDLFSSVPTIAVLRLGRAARIVRILRVLRAIRSAKILAEVILLRRAHGTFLAAALTAFLLVVVSSITILHVETAPNSNIKTAEDAVWWSIVTITTVGYGDRFPVTSEGRFIGGVLMFAGVRLFATFSGFVAAWFLRPGETKQDVSLEAIRQEIAQLRKALEARSLPQSKG
jgi:voltage-gated potassium channel